jgi:hypothetical protein
MVEKFPGIWSFRPAPDQTGNVSIRLVEVMRRMTHHLSIKSVIPSDQIRPISGSSFIAGTGAVTI